MIEAGNAAVSGMTAAEACSALGAVETGKMVAFNVIEGGGAQVIQLTEATAAEAFAAYEAAGGAVSSTGAASVSGAATANLTEIITMPGTASEAVATGGLLSLSLPTWVAAVAPLIGVAVGAGLYELSPAMWTKISRTLLPFCYPNTEVMPAVVDDGCTVYYEKSALDALKQLFQDEGVYDVETVAEIDDPSSLLSEIAMPIPYTPASFLLGKTLQCSWWNERITITSVPSDAVCVAIEYNPGRYDIYLFSKTPGGTLTKKWKNGSTTTSPRVDISSYYSVPLYQWAVNAVFTESEVADFRLYTPVIPPALTGTINADIGYTLLYGDIITDGGVEGLPLWTGDEVTDPSQGGIEVVTNPAGDSEVYVPGQLPTDVPFPGVSNDPSEYPDPTVPTPPPAIEPYINPEVLPSQYPEEVPAPVPSTRTAPLEDPVPAPEPSFDPSADPSQQPQNDPEPAEAPPPTPQPSGETPTPAFPIIPSGETFPDIVPTGGVSGLIHVYNPTPTQMIDFGRWLWVTYADASIDKIWNNPFDGIIGAHELYATPSTESTAEYIRSGFLVSTAQAKAVNSRYISIDCGSIVVPEYYANYLDYSPYSKAHVYLPFIGIVELDVDDIIGHGINIVYHIDTYNGSCIAQITVAKGEDYSNTVYQFSGNCSVEVPLAGGSQAAIKAGLISAAATGISSVVGGIATGLTGKIAGAVGSVAYGVGGAIAHAVSQKSSVQHSGSFGASYGAMGIKKPYIIVRRPVQKGLYNYNDTYGFPAHKRVIIGSCHGFLRVREVDVISPSATNEEKAQIEELLKAGVYID